MMSMTGERRRTSCLKAFTLIELLVVITIIGLLIALMMPSLQQARRSADRMTCATQMRQVGNALHMYNDTYNELPGPINGAQTWRYGGSYGRRGMHFVSQIFPFLGLPNQRAGTEVRPLRCPACRRRFGPHTVENPLPQNLWFGHVAYRDRPHPFGSFNLAEPGTNWGDRIKRLPISLSAIPEVSRVPAWRDNERADFVHHVDQRNYLFLDGHVRAYDIDDPDILRHPSSWPRAW